MPEWIEVVAIMMGWVIKKLLVVVVVVMVIMIAVIPIMVNKGSWWSLVMELG